MSNDSELTGPTAPETPAPNTEEKERKETEGGVSICNGTEREAEERSSARENYKESKQEEREMESRCDQTWENGESEGEGTERKFKNGEMEDNVELVESRDTEPRKDTVEEREEVERGEEDEEEGKERGSEPSEERSIQVLDGHIALGSVQWKNVRAKVTGSVAV